MKPILNLNEQLQALTFKVCKSCNIEKVRIVNGHYPNVKDTRYVDKDGKEWNGYRCPDCHRVKVAIRKKTKYIKDKIRKGKINAKRREQYRLTGK